MEGFSVNAVRAVIIGVVLAVAYLWIFKGERAERIKIFLSAFRTGVRDKGETGQSPEGIWVHSFCYTRARVGILFKKKTPVQYCWRCEMVLSEIDPSSPGKGIPPPDDQDRKVINLDAHRKK